MDGTQFLLFSNSGITPKNIINNKKIRYHKISVAVGILRLKKSYCTISSEKIERK